MFMKPSSWCPIVRATRCSVVLTAIAVSSIAYEAIAQPISFLAWNSALGGSYNAAGNWNPIGVPEGPFLGAAFSLNGLYTVTFPTDISLAAALVTDGQVVWDLDSSGTARTYSPGSLGVGGLSGGASAIVGGGAVNTSSLLVSNNGLLTVNADALVNVADGTATVDGQGSVWTQSAGLRVGDDATGTLDILNGGEVNTANSFGNVSFIGYESGSNGTVTVQGMGSTKASIWDSSPAVTVGRDGTGTLNILDGGVVEGIGSVGALAGSVGTVTIDGSGSLWTGGSIFVGSQGTGSVSILNGGMLESRHGIIGVSDGSEGTVTVEGPGSTWTNPDSLSPSLTVGREGAGTLVVADGGLVDTPLDVRMGGFLAGQNGTGTLRFGIGDDGAGLLEVGGELSVRDGTALFDLYVDDGVALEVNDSFTLVDYGTLEAGFAFDNLSDDQLFDFGPYSFLVDFNADLTGGGDFGIVATVAAVALPGDFNGDGTVDAADYALWRSDPGSYGGAQGYTDWVNNFGQTLGSSSGSPTIAAAVPEPASALLMMLGAVFGIFGRRRIPTN